MQRSELPHRASAAILALAALASCGPSSPEPAQTPTKPAAQKPTEQAAVPPSNEVQVARELAAAYFSKDDTAKAREVLAPLVTETVIKSNAATEDLVAAASIELRMADVAKAKAFLERAAKQSPDDPAVNYDLGWLAGLQTDFKAAAKYFEKALAAAPDDAPTKLHLYEAIKDDDPVRAEKLLREVIARGVDNLGPWYTAAVFKLGTVLVREDATMAEGIRLQDEFRQLSARGIVLAGGRDFDVGNFGRIRAPAPRGNRPGASHLPQFGAPQTICPEFAGATRVFASDLDNDGKLDLVACGPKGLVIGLQRANFAWETRVLDNGAVDRALAFDLGNDDDMDILFARGKELHLLEAVKDGTPPAISWRAWTGKMPELPSPPRDMLAVDFDHEGDLDLLFAGDFGARLFRNDGAHVADKGAFTDVTAEAGLPSDRKFDWCAIEDFDTDQDVDLLFGGASGAFLASNLRGGKFEDKSAWIEGVDLKTKPILADFDGDARPDLVTTGQPAALWLGKPSGKLQKASETAVSGRFAVDLDLDGALDVIAEHDGKLAGRLDVGLPSSRELTGDLTAPHDLALIEDIDGDLAWDELALTANGVEVRRGAQPGANPIRLAFRGGKDNRRGVGAIVELRAGPIYRRIFWLGEVELAGVGDQKELDVLRITWPNGVVQYETSRELGDRAVTKDTFGLLQSNGQVGSCPFLYTWDGEKYVFVTDVLGITPLGLPMEPGMLVPPDHDEYVLVRGDQLKPKDGVYELHFTEELREVTYLDRIRLDVVDSPIGVEIYPNELFCFPPFPEAHTHTVRAPLAPKHALGSDGKDWAAALAKIDDEYAAPFTPIENQLVGLANPHTLDLEFDRDAVATAKKLRLVMTGWFFWTDASVNMASARDPETKFVPPLLQVPDGAGGWKETGPPIGFPAGKTKSMVIDVTALLNRDDPRLRLFSTLRLYWDSIRLAVDDDDAELVTRSLEPTSAKLWRRGFSNREDSAKPNQPQRFVWEKLAPFPRWNQHPGLYTKYGETLPLVQQVDDQFVILGAGDALTVKFDAASLPPPRAGFKRDYLVFLDGWAKDRDPNTIEALYVEPLPFHAMSGYPYRADEHFPDDAAHQAWRREWNTRESYPWIEALTVAR